MKILVALNAGEHPAGGLHLDLSWLIVASGTLYIESTILEGDRDAVSAAWEARMRKYQPILDAGDPVDDDI